jgi:organic radical activating enzyme
MPSSVGVSEDVPYFAFQQHITKKDWLKFVVFDQTDYIFALEKVFHCKEGKDKELRDIQIALSPGFDRNGKDTLAIWKQWFLNSALLRRHGATLNYQIHKILGLE